MLEPASDAVAVAVSAASAVVSSVFFFLSDLLLNGWLNLEPSL